MNTLIEVKEVERKSKYADYKFKCTVNGISLGCYISKEDAENSGNNFVNKIKALNTK